MKLDEGKALSNHLYSKTLGSSIRASVGRLDTLRDTRATPKGTLGRLCLGQTIEYFWSSSSACGEMLGKE